MEISHFDYRNLDEIMNDINITINKGIKFIRKLKCNRYNKSKSIFFVVWHNDIKLIYLVIIGCLGGVYERFK